MSCASRRRSSSAWTKFSRPWRDSRRRSEKRSSDIRRLGANVKSGLRLWGPRFLPIRLSPPMFYVRPIARDDLQALLTLSERTGAGLTTLPANAERLDARIRRALASFAGAAEKFDECFVFVLVDGANDHVVGISAIEAAVGLTEPWYNYHVGTQVHASRELDLYTASPTLFLTNDHTGHSELCSLFLDARYRHGRNGPLLSKARLLFIAEFAQRFAPKIIAELRGKLDANGKSPFWEGLGRHFFAMEYSRADYLTGIGQKAFIAELMPRHPVYTALLPDDARAAIGEVHADTLPARAMLEAEGFRYEGYVDIFDAGPTLECFRDNIRAVQQSRTLPVKLGEEDPVPDSLTNDVLWLVANRSFERFRAVLAPAPARVAQFPLLPHAAVALGVGDGDIVRAVPLSPRDRL